MAESWGEGDLAVAGGGAAAVSGMQDQTAGGGLAKAGNLQELVQQLEDPSGANTTSSMQQQQEQQEWLRQRGMSAPPGAWKGMHGLQQSVKGRKEASQSAMLAGKNERQGFSTSYSV
jgi:hypothetical protein